MLERLLGNHTTVKVMEVLACKENSGRWLSLREIARQAGNVNPGTIKRAVDSMMEKGILIEQQPSRGMRIFQANTEDELVKKFIAFYQDARK